MKQDNITDTPAERQPDQVALSNANSATADHISDAVREAAWEILDILDHGAMTWAQLAAEAPAWSDPTLRRACRVLKAAGAVVLLRKQRLWARVDDVELPPALWPREALLAAVLDYQAKIEAAP